MEEQIKNEKVTNETDINDIPKEVKKRKRQDKSLDKHLNNMKPSYIESPIYNEEAMQRVFDGIAQNIRIQMDKEGLTLRELEYKSGVHFSHLSRVFNGKCRIGFDALIRIAAAFEMSPTDFFPYDKNQRMTSGQKFDEITKCLDVKSQNFLLEMCIMHVKEYNRVKFECIKKK